jgi:hypothetical protein
VNNNHEKNKESNNQILKYFVSLTIFGFFLSFSFGALTVFIKSQNFQ